MSAGADVSGPEPRALAEPGERRRGVRVAVTRCPYCHEDLDPGARDELVACERCLSRHHEACWDEGRRCACCGGLRRLRRPRARPAGGPGAARVLAAGLVLLVLTLAPALLIAQQVCAARRAAAAAVAAEHAARGRAARAHERAEADLRAGLRAERARRARAERQAEAARWLWEVKERAWLDRERGRAAADAALRVAAQLQRADRVARARAAETRVTEPSRREVDRALGEASRRALAGDLHAARALLDRVLSRHDDERALRRRAVLRLQLGDARGAADDAVAALCLSEDLQARDTLRRAEAALLGR